MILPSFYLLMTIDSLIYNKSQPQKMVLGWRTNMPAGRIKGQKLSSEQLEAYRAKRREKKDKWGGEAFKRKEESDAPFIDVGFYMTVTWSTGRQIPRRKMQP